LSIRASSGVSEWGWVDERPPDFAVPADELRADIVAGRIELVA
jgi:hypothetical protein